MGRRRAECFALLLAAGFTLIVALPVFAQAGSSAGQVTAAIPEGLIVRPKQLLDTNVGTDVLWNDLIRTIGGRVRITLQDTSVLNIGSNASVRVIKHNLQTRQTEVTLSYGKMRSRMTQLSGGENFEVKTNTAIVGVIGTDFFSEATLAQTKVIVYEGAVRLRNIDPTIPGETIVQAGQRAVVRVSEPPSPAEPATRQELEESLRDTEVGPPLPAPTLPTQAAQAQPTAPAPQPLAPPLPATGPGAAPAPVQPSTTPAGRADEWASLWLRPFSADQIITQGRQRHRAKLHARENAFRMETEAQGQRSIMIMRWDRNLIWTLVPDQQMYIEMPMMGPRDFAQAARDPNAKPERELLGVEQVGPYHCQKYRVRITSEGQLYTGIYWAALELNGFAVKWLDEKTGTTVEYENIRLDPPDPALFEVPPGYRKMTY